MAVTPQPLWPVVQVAAAPTTLYTAPATGRVVVKRVVFLNTDTSARTLSVYVIPAAGVAATTNKIISGLVLSAGQAYVAPELTNLVLGSSSFIQAVADVAGKINTIGSGFVQ